MIKNGPKTILNAFSRVKTILWRKFWRKKYYCIKCARPMSSITNDS